MADFNRVLFLGRLTRDPELKYTRNETAVAEFGLAVNREWTDASGDRKKEVCFIECVAWAKRAEVIDKYLEKGSPIFIEGHLAFDQWEDRETGAKRSKHKLVVDNFQFIGSRKDGEGGSRENRGDRAPQRDEERGDGPGSDRPTDNLDLDAPVPF